MPVEACEAWKARFEVILRCRDCGRGFELDRGMLNLTVELTAAHTRMLLVGVPEGCPGCRNMKVVDGVFDDEPDTSIPERNPR